MNKRTCLLLACAWLSFFCAAHAGRAQGAHTVEGRVALPDGAQPSHPVKVTLTFNGRRVYENFTDLSGRFSFGGLGRGTYQLTAEGDGLTFETTSVQVEVSAFGSAPQTFTQNVQLSPKNRAGIAPAATVSVEELDPTVPGRAREKYRQGVKKAVGNQPEEAAKLFQEAVKVYPPFYSAQLALAEQLMKLQRHAEALAAYRKAGEAKPDRAEPYVGVGISLVNLQRYEEGIRILRGVVEVDQELAAPYLSLGYAEMMLGDDIVAETHLLRAYELTKASIAHIYLANVYERLEQPAKAIEHLQAYLTENPQTPNASALRSAIEKLRKKLKAGQ